MLEEVLVGLKELWAVAPDVAVNAALLFLALSVLKGLGVLKKETWIQFSNLFGAWLFNDRVIPDNFADMQELYMTAVLAAAMFQVWKFARNKFGLSWDNVVDFFKKTKVSVTVVDTTELYARPIEK